MNLRPVVPTLLRACGTRYVAHQVSALSRLVEYFGAYLSHLAALTEDTTVKSMDKQRLKGYLTRWQQGKFLIGCAFFADLVKPASILCKTLQEDELCIVRPIEALGKAKRGFNKVRATTLEELPMVRKVIAHVSYSEDPASSVFPWLASAGLRSHITCLQQKIQCQEKCIVRGLCPQTTKIISDNVLHNAINRRL